MSRCVIVVRRERRLVRERLTYPSLSRHRPCNHESRVRADEVDLVSSIHDYQAPVKDLSEGRVDGHRAGAGRGVDHQH